MFTIFRTSIFLISRSVCDRSGRTTPSGLYREALRRKCPALYAFVSLKHCLLCESSHCLCCQSHYESCCLHSESCHCLLWWSQQVPTLWVPPLSTLCHHCLLYDFHHCLLCESHHCLLYESHHCLRLPNCLVSQDQLRFRSFLNFHFPSYLGPCFSPADLEPSDPGSLRTKRFWGETSLRVCHRYLK